MIDSQRVPGDLSVGFSSQKVRKGPDLVFYPFFSQRALLLILRVLGDDPFGLTDIIQ